MTSSKIPPWIKVAARMSRFPHYWVYMAGLFSWGWLATGRPYDSVFVVWALWFAVPGNFFYCAINDAFDQEQDSLNPRKKDLEGAASSSERTPFLVISLLSLGTVAPILLFSGGTQTMVFLSWVFFTVAYNVPPLRLKRFPLVDVVFGGVGQCATVALFGYLVASGVFPPAAQTSWFFFFVATYHFMGASFDAPFDRRAGLRHSTALIGTVRGSLRASAAVATLAAAGAIALGKPLWALPPLALCGYALAESSRASVETDTLLGFRRYTIAVTFVGFAVGLYLYL